MAEDLLREWGGGLCQSVLARAVSQTEQKMARLEEKLQRKDEVIAEIMAEHIQLKKELGES